MARSNAAFLALGLCLAATAAWAGSIADLPYRIGGDGRVSTDVSVDGKGPFSFVLDTASSRTMLFEHTRQKLGLAPSAQEPLKVYAMNNVGMAMPVKPRELRLADQPVIGLTLGVLPDETGMPDGVLAADGILGLDAIAQYLIVLDHDALRLKLFDVGGSEADTYRKWTSAELTPYHARDIDVTFWWLRAHLGTLPVTALLDMGSGITMINWNTAKRLGLKPEEFRKDTVPQDLRDALGTLEPVVTIRGLPITIGDRIFPAQNVIVADAAVFRYFGLENGDAAIIGPAMLRYNSLAIDFGKRRLYIGPSTAPPDAPS